MEKFLIGLICVWLLFSPGAIIAQTASPSAEIVLKQEAINPDSMFYPVKRLWEKVESYFVSFDKSHDQNFQKELAQIRLNELAYIAKNNKYEQFKDASSRYVTLLQQMMNSKNIPTEIDKKAITKRIDSLKKLQQKYNGDYAYWSFLQQAIETSQKYLSQSH